MPLVPQILDFSLLDVSPGALKGPRLSPRSSSHPSHFCTRLFLVKVTTTLPACLLRPQISPSQTPPASAEKNNETSHQPHPQNISPMCPLLPSSPDLPSSSPLAHHGSVFLQSLPMAARGVLHRAAPDTVSLPQNLLGSSCSSWRIGASSFWHVKLP